jgi:hypothetical protein
MRLSIWIPLALLGAWALACQNAPANPSLPPPEAAAAPTDFSGDAAFAHLRALVAIGPRVSGTPGAAQARAYLRAELEKLGLAVGDRRFAGPPGPTGAPLELVNLMVGIPGESPQRFVLAAAYDTRRFDQFRFVGANDGASGPALLLELARVIQAHPLPYTTWIVFLDGEAPVGAGSEPPPAPSGSQLLAQELLAEGAVAPVRLVVTFQQVGDAELHVARDLRSHRLFREEFWLAAERIGRSDAFRSDEAFESPPGSHLAFIAAGFRGVVQITDSSYGGELPPGGFANSEDDTPERCSPQSLETVGSVTLEALGRIGERLAKIDRLTRPGAAAAETEAAPEADAPSAPQALPAPSAPSAPTAPPAP